MNIELRIKDLYEKLYKNYDSDLSYYRKTQIILDNIKSDFIILQRICIKDLMLLLQIYFQSQQSILTDFLFLMKILFYERNLQEFFIKQFEKLDFNPFIILQKLNVQKDEQLIKDLLFGLNIFNNLVVEQHQIWDEIPFLQMEIFQEFELKSLQINLILLIMKNSKIKKDNFIQQQFDQQSQYNSHNFIQELFFELQLQKNQIDKKIIDQECSINKKQKKELNLSFNQQQSLNKLEEQLIKYNLVVLDGPLQSGKSLIIKNLERQSIRVYIDNQTDLKQLIGCYICTDKIGQFEWANGPLTQAMNLGQLLILENFQEANDEVINGIIEINNNQSINLVNQKIVSKNGFKILLISNFLSKQQQKLQQLVKNNGFVKMEKLDFNQIIELYELTKYEIKSYIINLINLIKIQITPYQMICFIRRLNYQTQNFYENEKILNLTNEFKKLLFQEIFDCFFVKLYEIKKHEQDLIEILNYLNIPKIELDILQNQHYPQFELSNSQIKIQKLGLLDRQLFAIKDENQSVPQNIVYNAYSCRYMEKIASCLYFNENCLLVGDTGCGKTTLVQHIANIFYKKLHVYNMNQGSDAVDLIGGFKPIQISLLIQKLLIKYVKNFGKIVKLENNKQFIDSLTQLYENRSFNNLIKCLQQSLPKILEKVKNDEKLTNKFKKIQKQLQNIYQNKDKIESNLAFHFIEGNLIKAVKQGDWILIDEINLANNEVLQRLLPLLEGESILLYDRGDLKEIKRHKQFKILGCMNPGIDVGKKELPPNIRCKFSEIYVQDQMSKVDLEKIVQKKINKICQNEQCEQVVDLYIEMKQLSEQHILIDNQNKRPHISLRNLSRSLNYIIDNNKMYGQQRSLYDGLYLGFGSSLSKESKQLFEQKLAQITQLDQQKYQQLLNSITLKNNQQFVNVFGFYMQIGNNKVKQLNECEFLVTNGFKMNLTNLLRAVSNSDLPVLLEGPTSAGKTSMVKFIAELSGNKCVRINNHQHTDIEEYIGTYLPDNKGRLVFTEGVLVEAIRNGHWIILDELNLARSEILESLNRLLDDNKELFINETQEFIKPKKGFRIFATQNPTSYGGRKELSKAFKNRFIQMYFDDINDEDLLEILQKRCDLPLSYSKKILSVTKELKLTRQQNNFFQGKEGVVTVRDLIKWSKREISSKEDLAYEGFAILGERLRTSDERHLVQQIIEKQIQVKLNLDQYYQEYYKKRINHDLGNIQINQSFIRMCVLTHKAIEKGEPVLLVGDTGCGKTTVCQILSNGQMFSVNCHQNSESSDFLGSLRPLRNKEQNYIQNLTLENQESQRLLNSYLSQQLTLDKLLTKLKKLEKDSNFQQIQQNLIKYESLFEWQDGPLIQAMQQGKLFLIDEISLAEDSVLERLNSVLEAEQTLTLPEKGGEKADQILAQKGFVIVATMNPGGDFGKRELTPALRNRFTEVWVEAITGKHYLSNFQQDIIQMLQSQFRKVIKDDKIVNDICRLFFKFIQYFNLEICTKYGIEKRSITMRDIVGVLEFFEKGYNLSIQQLYINAIDMIGIEPLFFSGLNDLEIQEVSNLIKQFISIQIIELQNIVLNCKDIDLQQQFGIEPFYLNKKNMEIESDDQFKFVRTQTTDLNLIRILRGLQLNKSILLEGNPGVGKTSLIQYLADQTGQKLYQITLSEQTDMIDLLGSDLPQEHNDKVQFKWHDGILLQALKRGHWIILDELNLASQTVLEGLNAILDHRGSVYIPEINQTFVKHDNFRLFATQSSISIGGGRKQLPSSFLNRFQKMKCRQMNLNDYENLLNHWNVDIKDQFIQLLSLFKSLNLRDIKRFFQIYKNSDLSSAVELVFLSNQQENMKQIQQIFKDLKFKKDYKFEGLLNGKYVQLQEDKLKLAKIAIDSGISLLITGVSNSGKSSFVEQLSALQNKQIISQQLNQSTDSSELIGSYEQVDSICILKQILQQIQNQLQYIRDQPLKLFTIFKKIQKNDIDINQIKQINCSVIQHLCDQYQQQQSKQTQFKWFFSELIKSLNSNCCFVLDNIQNCNQAVLSRLNPILDRSNVIIPEQTKDGDPMLLKPNQDFNLILIANDGSQIQEGIRNRCLEINLNQQMDTELFYQQLEFIQIAKQNIQNFQFIKQYANEFNNEYMQFIDQEQNYDQKFELNQINSFDNFKKLQLQLYQYQFSLIGNDRQNQLNQVLQNLKNQQDEDQKYMLNWITDKSFKKQTIQQQLQLFKEKINKLLENKNIIIYKEHPYYPLYNYESKELSLQQLLNIKLLNESLTNPDLLLIFKFITQDQIEEEYFKLNLQQPKNFQQFKEQQNLLFILGIEDESDQECLWKIREKAQQTKIEDNLLVVQNIYKNGGVKEYCQEIERIHDQMDYQIIIGDEEGGILKQIPVFPNLYSNQQIYNMCKQMDNYFKIQLLNTISLQNLCTHPLEKIYLQLIQPLISNIQITNISFKIKDIYPIQQINNQLQQQLNNELSFKSIVQQFTSDEIDDFDLNKQMTQEQQDICYQFGVYLIEKYPLQKEQIERINQKAYQLWIAEAKMKHLEAKRKAKLLIEKLITNRESQLMDKLKQVQQEVLKLEKEVIYRGNVQDFLQYMDFNLQFQDSTKLQDYLILIHQIGYYKYRDLFIPNHIGLLLIYKSITNQKVVQNQFLKYINSLNDNIQIAINHKSCLDSNSYYNTYINQCIEEVLPQEIEETEEIAKFNIFHEKATQYIINNQKLQENIVDEYTKEAVEKQKLQQELEIQQQFNSHDKDLQILVQQDQKLQDRLELIQEIEIEQQINSDYKQILLNLIKNQEQEQNAQFRFNMSQDLILNSLRLEKLTYLIQLKHNQLNVHKNTQYNSYHCNTLQQIFYKILQRIHELLNLELFQENQVLQGLSILIDHIMDGKIENSPLIRLIQGVQLTLEKIFDWNNMTPKIYNIEYEELNKLLSEWRKLERKSWKSILDQKIEELELEDVQLFLRLQNVFKLLKNKNELCQILEQYLKKSKMGQYQFRIQQLLFQTNASIKHRKIIQQVLNFYNNYQDNYNDKMKSTINKSQKEIRECEVLVGWDSNNFHVLKSTVEKFHKRLYKIGKSYKDFLNENFSQIIDQFQQNQLFSSIEQISSYLSTHSQLNNIKIIFQNIQANHQIVKQAQKLLCIDQYESHKELDEITLYLFERLDSLKDGSFTKLIKQRAVQDLFKTLKSLGLTSFFKSFQITMEQSIFVLYNFKNFNTQQLDQQSIQQIQKSENYYYKVLERVTYFKQNTTFHTDLDRTNIQKAIGFIFEFFFKYRMIHQQVNQNHQMILDSFKTYNLENKIVYQKDPQINIILDQIQYELYCISENAIEDLQKIKQLMEINYKIQQQDQFIYEYQIKDFKKAIQNYTDKTYTVYENLQNNKIKTLFKNQLKLIIYLDNLNNQIEYQNIQLPELSNDDQQIIIKQLQLITQQLNQEIVLFNKEFEQDDIKMIDVILQYNKKISYIINIRKLNKIYNKLQQFQYDQQISQFLEILINAFKTLIQNQILNLLSLSKFMYVITVTLVNIIYKGFCQPDDEEQNDKDHEGNFEDAEGTGVGEGKGMENKSKEIEFEEQIMGMKGDDEDDDDNQDQDFEQDAFSMEQNDFEGQTKEQKKDENQNEQEEDKNKDLDEEMSQVDDQLDHKLWNDQISKDEENEDENQEQRNQEDLDFKGEQPQENMEQRAKQQEKERQDQRNIDEFEECSVNEQPKEDHQNQEDEDDQQSEFKSNNDLSVQNNPEGDQISEVENDDNLSIKFSENKSFEDGMEEEENDQDNNNDENAENNEEKEEKQEQIDNFENIDDQMSQMEIEEDLQQVSKPNQEQQGQEGVENGQDSQQVQNGQNNKNNQENQENQENQDNQNNNDGQNNQKEQEKSTFSKEFMNKIMQNIQQDIDKEKIDEIRDDLNVQENQEQQNNNNNNGDNNQEYETYDNQGEMSMAAQLSAQEQQKQDIQQQQKESQNERQKEQNQQQETIEKQQQQKQNNKNDQKMEVEDEQVTYDFDKMKESNPQQNQEQTSQQQQQIQKDYSAQQMEIEPVYFDIENNYNQENDKLENQQMLKQFENNQDQEVQQNWRKIEQETRYLSNQLSEDIKSVLEATKISQFRGDYKSGKRLNMKKIIPFIASNFRKDKIWLRRTDPAKRDYQIMIAIDDSLSMKENDVGYFAIKSSIIMALALTKAEVGQVAIAQIQDGLKIIHDFNKPFTQNDGAYLMSQFKFQFSNQNSADLSIPQFMRNSIDIFDNNISQSQPDHQICFIISDGLLNKKLVRPLCIEAEEKNQLYIMIILDKQQNSIMNIKSVTQNKNSSGKNTMVMNYYLEDFPFKHYIIIKDINDLSKILVQILRQYFELRK